MLGSAFFRQARDASIHSSQVLCPAWLCHSRRLCSGSNPRWENTDSRLAFPNSGVLDTVVKRSLGLVFAGIPTTAYISIGCHLLVQLMEFSPHATGARGTLLARSGGAACDWRQSSGLRRSSRTMSGSVSTTERLIVADPRMPPITRNTTSIFRCVLELIWLY